MRAGLLFYTYQPVGCAREAIFSTLRNKPEAQSCDEHTRDLRRAGAGEKVQTKCQHWQLCHDYVLGIGGEAGQRRRLCAAA